MRRGKIECEEILFKIVYVFEKAIPLKYTFSDFPIFPAYFLVSSDISSFFPYLDSNNAQYQEMIGRDERRFKKADKNGDSILSTEEFAAFLHPENDDTMKGIVIDETLEDIDKNGDGLIDLDEYIGELSKTDQLIKMFGI